MAVAIVSLVSVTLGPALYGGRQPDLGSFALVHFAGYLFFLLMPVEALVPYYQSEGHASTTLIVLAVGTALLAQAIDYWVGRSVSLDAVARMLGRKRFERYLRIVERWGAWAIFIFNLLPLSSPNMLLVAGISRFSAIKAFMLSLAGLLLKYVAIVAIVRFSI